MSVVSTSSTAVHVEKVEILKMSTLLDGNLVALLVQFKYFVESERTSQEFGFYILHSQHASFENVHGLQLRTEYKMHAVVCITLIKDRVCHACSCVCKCVYV